MIVRPRRTSFSRGASVAMNDRGQSLVEYLLIISLVVIGASQIVKRVAQSFDVVVLRVGAQLERDLKSGRAPLSVWRN